MRKSIRIAHSIDTHLGFRALSKRDPVTGCNQRAGDFERALECGRRDPRFGRRFPSHPSGMAVTAPFHSAIPSTREGRDSGARHCRLPRCAAAPHRRLRLLGAAACPAGDSPCGVIRGRPPGRHGPKSQLPVRAIPHGALTNDATEDIGHPACRPSRSEPYRGNIPGRDSMTS